MGVGNQGSSVWGKCEWKRCESQSGKDGRVGKFYGGGWSGESGSGRKVIGQGESGYGKVGSNFNILFNKCKGLYNFLKKKYPLNK